MLGKNRMVGLLVVMFLLASSGQASAQTTSLQQALTRMDEIIAQMQALRAEFESLQARVSGSATPQVQGAQTSSVGFTESLEVGATNDDIAYIQRLLATDPAIYPDGIVSGYYGPKTVEAIRNLQARFGLSTPGVIGPQTRTILEAFLTRYPDGNFPANVLAQIPQVPNPQVQGAATTITPTPTLASTPTIGGVSATNPASSISVEFDGAAADITIRYKDGSRKELLLRASDEDDAVRMIVRHTDLTAVQVREAMTVADSDDDEGGSSGDEDEAEEALDAADEAIEDAEDEIEEAEEDGEDVDWAEDTLDDAEDLLEEAEEAFDDGDFDEAIDLAEEAEEMAEKAEDRIGEEAGGKPGDSDEIEEITAKIGSDETEVTVEYEDDPDYEFTVDETDEDDVIEEIADELDIDEDDVEDLIEFEGRDIDEIDVELYDDDDRAIADVEFENGDEKRYLFDTTDEDDIIEELADRLNLDEDDIEDVIRFTNS